MRRKEEKKGEETMKEEIGGKEKGKEVELRWR